jgi:hypothetical protein
MGQKGKASMLTWLRRRRERSERIEVEAGELLRLLGADAYGEARWREQTTSSDLMAQEWNLIALAIARSTGRRIGIDTSTRMAMNAVFAADREPPHKGRLHSEPESSDELTRILTKKPFRIQFIGTTPDRARPILKEVDFQGSDVSSAVVFAAKLDWPPKTTGLRIIDCEGREVFERHKADRR